MANVATLTAKMVMDVSGFTAGSNRVASDLGKMKGIAAGMGSMFAGISAGMLAATAATTALNAAASAVRATFSAIGEEMKHGFGLAMQAESAETSFRVLLGDAEKAKALMKDIQNFTMATPFTMQGSLDSVKKLMGAGVTEDRMMSTLRMLGELSGGNTEALGLMAHTYGEVMSKTRVLSSEMNQISAAGINMRQALADEAGVAVSDLSKAIEAGKVSSINFHNALVKLSTTKYKGGLEAASKDIQGSWDRIKEIRDDLDRKVVESLAKKWGIAETANELASLADLMKNAAVPVIVDGFSKMADGAFEFADNLRAIGLLMPTAFEVAGGASGMGQWAGRLAGGGVTSEQLAGINTKRDIQAAFAAARAAGRAHDANKPPLAAPERMGGAGFAMPDINRLFVGSGAKTTLRAIGNIFEDIGFASGRVASRFSIRSGETQEQKPTGALVAGSSEAFSAIIRSMFGQDKGKEELKTLMAIEKAVGVSGKAVVEAIKNQITGVLGALGT